MEESKKQNRSEQSHDFVSTIEVVFVFDLDVFGLGVGFFSTLPDRIKYKEIQGSILPQHQQFKLEAYRVFPSLDISSDLESHTSVSVSAVYIYIYIYILFISF